MTPRHVLPLIIASLALGALAAGAARDRIQLAYTDLTSRYAIIGPLQVELGKVMTLEVEKIESHRKGDPPTLRVLAINGKKPAAPVVCPYRMLALTDRFQLNQVYRVKAYQDGEFTGTPREVLQEVMVQSSDYAFEVTLVVFKYLTT